MLRTPRIGAVLLTCWLATGAFGQQPVPIADSPDRPILPGGVSLGSVSLEGELVYLFTEEDGTEAVHLVGDARIRLGDVEGLTLRAREALVWMTPREHEGRAYQHFQVLLWQDGEVVELGGTITAGPALFVMFNSLGEVSTLADDVAFVSSADSPIYQEGDRIREALAAFSLRGPEEEVGLRIFDATGLTTTQEIKPKPVMNGTFKSITIKEINGVQVYTATGGVHLSRGIPGAGDYLELSAENVVVFGTPPDADQPRQVRPPSDPGAPRRIAVQESSRRRQSRQQLAAGLVGEVGVEGVYLEGDVVMSQGPNVVRASRIYYDLTNDRALILDAVIRTMAPNLNLPIYLRAEEIRQVSLKQFSAEDAMLTTSEFYTPHYYVGAKRIEVINRTADDPTGELTAVRSGTFRINHATLNFGGFPVAYWPYIFGSVDASETSIQSTRLGYSDDFGAEIEFDFELFNVLGLETPVGFDATLSLNYFSRRGTAIGVDLDYERDDSFGLVRSYLLAEEGEDDLGREREVGTTSGERGRFLLRHRQYLPEDWELSLEVSYISDRNFLEEFFESEFDNDKEQETLLYVKRQRENWALTGLLQFRILGFTTQTESFPELAFRVLGEPLGESGVTLYSEYRAGLVRLRGADQNFREFLRDGPAPSAGTTVRVDVRQEVGLPFDYGALRLVPFASIRGTAWDDTPERGGLQRVFGTYGLRGSMYLTRVFPDVRSEMFDINGVRHIIKPHFVVWASHTNVDGDDVFPFDTNVDQLSEIDGAAVGVRQRWQTKRGPPGRERTVDVLTHDLEVGVFNDTEGEAVTNGFTSFSRPEESIARNYLNSTFTWRVNDRTAFLAESSFDLNDGANEIFNFSMMVDRSPRLSYLVGYRFIDETDSNLLAFDANYQMTEKHMLALRELFDLDRGRTLDFTVGLITKFPHWFTAVSFQLDEAEDDFGISFSLWPEGFPNASLGSRRFKGLSNSSNIRY